MFTGGVRAEAAACCTTRCAYYKCSAISFSMSYWVDAFHHEMVSLYAAKDHAARALQLALV
jgi:hypothetical protein